MGLPKGRSNNLAGKPPGALNKITKDLRQDITDFLENNFDEVVREWHKLQGKEKLQLYKDLIQYAVPKMQSVEMKTEFDRLTDEDLQTLVDKLRK